MRTNIDKFEGNGNKVIPKHNDLRKEYNETFEIIDDVVLKNYITKLRDMDIIPLDKNILKNNISDNVRLFKINHMVYQNDEHSAYKFASVFNAVASTKSTLFILIDSDGEKTEFYMGIRSVDENSSTKTCYDTLSNSIKGQFPGIKTTNLLNSDMEQLFSKIQSSSISAISGIANSKNKDNFGNENFIQGLEKLAQAMQGERYTGIIIANTIDQAELLNIRRGYEDIYTKLSPFANMQVGYGNNNSTSASKSYNEGISEGENRNSSFSTSISKGSSETTTKSDSLSKETAGSVIGKTAGTSLALAGATIGSVIPGVGTLIGGAIGAVAGTLVSSASHRTSTSSSSSSNTYTENETVSKGETVGSSKTVNRGTTDSNTLTAGSNETLQLNIQNKSIISCLERIDKQLLRIDEFESVGMWECAAYFLSDNSYASEMAASTYKALMNGENSGVEVSAINVWNKRDKEKTDLIKQYVTNLIHPIFKYRNNGAEIPITPTSLVSANELSIHMGLPRKSVCGFPVIEHADFAKEIVSYNKSTSKYINIGKIFNMGTESTNRALIDVNSLAMHTFITGSTGSGKSNTVYELLDQLNNMNINFLVIEPAKGEYKNIFARRKDVTVLGTNPNYSELLKINPFKFPNKIHVLEHIDRLVEIFNVCWPMYAAMPAVLKDAILQAYEVCGWDLNESKNKYSDNLFPTFTDLQIELINVIKKSAYSEELKSNYIGSLSTRVKSLTNGLNGQIFTSDEVDNNILFDKNVIVDLSRVGSSETKSLIMGILIMRLNEHRMSFADGMNIPLKHVTVLEEAHNILKRTSTEQSAEGSNMIGKSVEMISNSIAEMRTYGEGFIIADQSASAVDISAIRNTNTKIIMRLPDEVDRRLAGKSAALKDNQLDEIAKLPKGVAVIYQNDWLEPVLCKVNKYECNEEQYVYKKENVDSISNKDTFVSEFLKLLLQGRVVETVEINIDLINKLLDNVAISSKNKIVIHYLLKEYISKNELAIWEIEHFDKLSSLVTELLECKMIVKSTIESVTNFEILTVELGNFIKERTLGLSNDTILAISQCLLKDYSMESKEALEIYSAWRHEIEQGGRVI